MCPKLLTIYGPIAIQSYGFMILFGLLVFLGVTYFHPRRAKLMPGDVYINVVFGALLVGVLGGRVLGVIADWSSFKENPIEIFYPWIGGFVVVGAIAAIVFIMPLYLWWNRVPVLETFDFAAVYAPMLQAIGRFGCLLAGCCYGMPLATASWWSVTFVNPEAHIPPNLLGIPLFPAQLFTSAASGLIFVFMLLLHKRFTRVGQAALFYLMSEDIARFLVDFWRGDRQELFAVYGFCLEISKFQAYSGIFFMICCVAFVGISIYGKPIVSD